MNNYFKTSKSGESLKHVYYSDVETNVKAKKQKTQHKLLQVLLLKMDMV